MTFQSLLCILVYESISYFYLKIIILGGCIMLLLSALVTGLAITLLVYLLSFAIEFVIILAFVLISKVAFRTFFTYLKLKLLLKAVIFVPFIILYALISLGLYFFAILDFIVIVGILILITKKLKKKGG